MVFNSLNCCFCEGITDYQLESECPLCGDTGEYEGIEADSCLVCQDEGEHICSSCYGKGYCLDCIGKGKHNCFRCDDSKICSKCGGNKYIDCKFCPEDEPPYDFYQLFYNVCKIQMESYNIDRVKFPIVILFPEMNIEQFEICKNFTLEILELMEYPAIHFVLGFLKDIEDLPDTREKAANDYVILKKWKNIRESSETLKELIDKIFEHIEIKNGFDLNDFRPLPEKIKQKRKISKDTFNDENSEDRNRIPHSHLDEITPENSEIFDFEKKKELELLKTEKDKKIWKLIQNMPYLKPDQFIDILDKNDRVTIEIYRYPDEVDIERHKDSGEQAPDDEWIEKEKVIFFVYSEDKGYVGIWVHYPIDVSGFLVNILKSELDKYLAEEALVALSDEAAELIEAEEEGEE